MIIDYTIRLMRTFFVVLILLKVFAALCCGQDLLISLIKRRLSGRACVTRKPKEALGCVGFVSQLEYLLSLSLIWRLFTLTGSFWVSWVQQPLET